MGDRLVRAQNKTPARLRQGLVGWAHGALMHSAACVLVRGGSGWLGVSAGSLSTGLLSESGFLFRGPSSDPL